MNIYQYWRGRWRLHYSFCPQCNSSPPDPECWVCHGERRYGRSELTPNLKRWWRVVWDRAANEAHDVDR